MLEATQDARCLFEPGTEGAARLTLGGVWRLDRARPRPEALRGKLQAAGTRRLEVRAEGLGEWDSGLLVYLLHLEQLCAELEIDLDHSPLPDGVERLLRLATAVPEHREAERHHQYDLLSRIGYGATGVVYGINDLLAFIGEALMATLRVLRGRGRLRWRDLQRLLSECGAQALPIVSLIAFLVGIILAFVSAVQLELFGASIYVANLVGLGMARDMGAMMAAIIMAGRTGAAYAAQLGTMQVNEEIDALRTLGVSPMELLVVPRLLALMLMMPLLCVYADFMGILGGAVATASVTDVSLAQYFAQTWSSVGLKHFFAGFIKSGAYGLLVALAGCLRGLECGRSAQAVGEATTKAVVSGIVWIVVSCAVLTVIYYRVGL